MSNDHPELTPNTPSLPAIILSEAEKRNTDNFCDAKNSGSPNYEGLCPVHGWTPFDTGVRKCLTCFDRRGASRSTDGPRAAARRIGERKYIGECAVHGPAWFGVRYGKCLECFTTDGARRAVRPSYLIGEDTAEKPG